MTGDQSRFLNIGDRLTVDNNGPLAVFAIALNNRYHLRRFGFSLFDRRRIPVPLWTIVSA